MTKVKPSIGVFAAIFDSDGKLLVKRREEIESLPGDYDLPGGAVEEELAKEAKNESFIWSELAREVEEETGIDIRYKFERMPAMYPAILPSADWAFVIIVTGVIEAPSFGEYMYVSPKELQTLAEAEVGERLVSGVRKRMHRLCLQGLIHSPNKKYADEAKKMLARFL